jgi:2-desacetyl-2-hydroxyethyl bacteriochlorophyllide A dehydrogenase
MKAAVFYGPRDIRVEEVEKPKVEAGEILIKVRACGICGSDLHTYKLGIFPENGVLIGNGRMILGHEYSGDVAEIGGGVDGVKVGDRVTAVSMGGFAEYVKAFCFLNGNVYHLPPEVSYEEGAMNEPLATSLHAANVASPAEGDTILIAGTGIIGLGIIQVLKARHPNRVIVSDISEKRRAMARQLGADFVIDPTEGDLYEQVTKIVGTVPTMYSAARTPAIEIAIDCVGRAHGAVGIPVLDQLLNIVREGAKVVLVAAYEENVSLNPNYIMGKGLRVLGSVAYGPEELAGALELIRSRKVNCKPLISHQFSLDKAKEAFETQLKVKESIKVLVKP